MEQTENPQQETRAPTPVEALFLDAGLPVTQVEACPVEDCPICRAEVHKAA